jgi:hypothetical protein
MICLKEAKATKSCSAAAAAADDDDDDEMICLTAIIHWHQLLSK